MVARKRTQRRQDQREAQKLIEARAKLARLEAGGAPEHPETVQSASVIEPHAEARPCFACGATTRVQDHRAEQGLRIVSVQCKSCGRARELFYRLAARVLN